MKMFTFYSKEKKNTHTHTLSRQTQKHIYNILIVTNFPNIQKAMHINKKKPKSPKEK